MLIGAGGASQNVSDSEIDRELDSALETMSVRDAADAVAGKLGVKRRAVYQRALARAEKDAKA